MNDAGERVVFDCNIFAQTLITPSGNAGKCVERVLEGKIRLFWSDYVLNEVRQICEKPTPKRLGVHRDQIESLIARLKPVAHLVENPPSVFIHPIDPKDSHYVDLAVASDAKLIVSRDKHLLNLMNPSKPGAQQFKATFPNLAVLQPEQLLELLRGTAPRS
jgi:putative PIN family toxin of toxin-antitoxin system